MRRKVVIVTFLLIVLLAGAVLVQMNKQTDNPIVPTTHVTTNVGLCIEYTGTDPDTLEELKESFSSQTQVVVVAQSECNE